MDSTSQGLQKPVIRTMDIVNQGLKKRYASEKRFRMLGLAAIIASMLFLALLFTSIIGNGY
jgi:phosphate transport system permease protein